MLSFTMSLVLYHEIDDTGMRRDRMGTEEGEGWWRIINTLVSRSHPRVTNVFIVSLTASISCDKIDTGSSDFV